jgi:hypothetical protein
MRTRSIATAFLSVSLTLLGACAQEALPESAPIDVHPASLDQAKASITQIEALLRANPQDARALAARRALLPRLDELNHLVARVETTPGHVVSFYETEPGVIGVAENGPRGEARVLTEADVAAPSIVELYQKLSGGAAAPQALYDAEEREKAAAEGEHAAGAAAGLKSTDAEAGPVADGASPADGASRVDGVASTSSALTYNDGPWFAANGCYHGGDARGCLPTWTNGGYLDAYTKSSFFEMAPFQGTVYVQFQYEGSTRFVDPVFEGGWSSWGWHSSSHWTCCFICACGTQDYDIRHHRWDVLEGAGKGYHWSWEARWTCSGSDCDAP